MERLWAPWRYGYIKMEKSPGCIFCDKTKQRKDEENYIVYRGEKNFIILNSFPYNPGHLMVAPYSHIGNLGELTREEMTEHMELLARAVEALKKAFSPAGFNLGMNLGKIAGAGIEDHIHSHIVPRWQGDTNFMPVLADTRVLPEGLQSVYRKLREFIV
jgi:ATP adenylyltransferase